MRPDLPRNWRPLLLSTLLLGCTLIPTLWIWRQGGLQPLDFVLYDRFIRVSPRLTPAESPVVLIALTEEDIRREDYPLPDARLAQLLEALEAGLPRAIGLDLYRDLPEPRSGAGLACLNRVLTNRSNIIAIRRLPDASNPAIPPPSALEPHPERVGFNNFPVDHRVGRRIRRGLLFAHLAESGSETVFCSLALRLAQLYLEQEGVSPEPGRNDPEHLRLGKQEYAPLRHDDGAYVGLDAGGYQVLLEFGGPACFPTYPLSAVFDGEVPPQALRDKVVLVGAMAASVRDAYDTPVKAGSYGVELHAQLLTQLITRARRPGFPPRFLPEELELIVAAAGGMFGILLAWGARSIGLFLALLLAGLGFLVGLNQHGLQAGWWLPVAPAAVCFGGSAVLTTAYRVQREWRDRRILMLLFSKHVSKEIAGLIWAERRQLLNGKLPRPQSLVATVLFADLKGFTSVAEKADPVLVMQWLNEYAEAMAAQIIARGGIVNEYTGDGLMATFGVPLRRSTPEEISRDAQAAVASAVGMAEGLARLNAEWQDRGWPTTAMRVGICTGQVVTGSLGGPDRLKYAVVGDTVNAAARLESFDKDLCAAESPLPACRILVGESTWQRLGEEFAGRRLGSFALKGKEQPMTVYQIFSCKPNETP